MGDEDEQVDVTTTLAMPPASRLLAGNRPSDYWAARSGRALSTYCGAYVLLGAGHYLWWQHESSPDPVQWVEALEGLIGHAVELPAGNVTAEDVAMATGLVVLEIEGWGADQDGADLAITGPEAVTVGPGWDDASPGALVGMRSIDVAGPPFEGPITTVLAQHLPNPALALPIIVS